MITKQPIRKQIEGVLNGLSCLLNDDYLSKVEAVATMLSETLSSDGKILLFGNGGSAADAQHIAAELIGRYKRERRALAATALTTDTSVLTAWSNDYEYRTVFSRQVEGLGRSGDVAWGLSTSGSSDNVVDAIERAKALGLLTVAMVGRDGGKLLRIADHVLVVPLEDTARIQEGHMITYHVICDFLDAYFQN